MTRMDYLAPLPQRAGLLTGRRTPPRYRGSAPRQAIRVLMKPVDAHLFASDCHRHRRDGHRGHLDDAVYGFREREIILAFFEKVTGLRMNHNYIRPGGVAADLPPGWREDVNHILDVMPERLAGYRDLLSDNPICRSGANPQRRHHRRRGVPGLQRHRPHPAAPPACPGTSGWPSPARRRPVRVRGPGRGTRYIFDRYLVRMMEMDESLKIVRQAMDTMPKGDYRAPDRKITPPTSGPLDESMEALIHQLKIFTEGFKVPPPG